MKHWYKWTSNTASITGETLIYMNIKYTSITDETLLSWISNTTSITGEMIHEYQTLQV